MRLSSHETSETPPIFQSCDKSPKLRERIKRIEMEMKDITRITMGKRAACLFFTANRMSHGQNHGPGEFCSMSAAQRSSRLFFSCPSFSLALSAVRTICQKTTKPHFALCSILERNRCRPELTKIKQRLRMFFPDSCRTPLSLHSTAEPSVKAASPQPPTKKPIAPVVRSHPCPSVLICG